MRLEHIGQWTHRVIWYQITKPYNLLSEIKIKNDSSNGLEPFIGQNIKTVITAMNGIVMDALQWAPLEYIDINEFRLGHEAPGPLARVLFADDDEVDDDDVPLARVLFADEVRVTEKSEEEQQTGTQQTGTQRSDVL